MKPQLNRIELDFGRLGRRWRGVRQGRPVKLSGDLFKAA